MEWCFSKFYFKHNKPLARFLSLLFLRNIVYCLSIGVKKYKQRFIGIKIISHFTFFFRGIKKCRQRFRGIKYLCSVTCIF